MQNKKSFAFFEIHPFVLPLALLLSLIAPVYYWKCDSVPVWMRRRLRRLVPKTLFEEGQFEWNAVSADAYDGFTAHLDELHRVCRPTATIDGGQVDLTNLALIETSSLYEAHYQFFFMLRRQPEIDGGTVRTFRTVFKRNMEDAGIGFPGQSATVVSGAETLDGLWQHATSFIKIARVTLRTGLAMLRKAPAEERRFKMMYQSISFNEMATGPNRYDFSSILEQTGIDKSDIVFLLPIPPGEPVRAWLKARGVNWIVFQNLASKLTPPRSRALLRDLVSLLFGLNTGSRLAAAGGHMRTRVADRIVLYHLIRQMEIETLLTSNGGIETESALTAMLRAKGVRTIMWQYAQAGVIPVKFRNPDGPAVKRQRLVQSVLLGDEQWVWYDCDRRLLAERCIQPDDLKPVYRITGPVMAGESHWIMRRPEEARKLAAEAGAIDFGAARDSGGLWLSLFDIDTKHPDTLTDHRAGPNRFPAEIQAQFFSDLMIMLERFPELRILYKPKRRRAADRFFLTEELLAFTDPDGWPVKTGRVICLDNNIDPYIPIGACDCALGVPFTSGVMVANSYGRPGMFYDPLGNYLTCYPRENEALLLNGPDQLASRIEGWIKGDRAVDPVVATFGCPDGDPIANFADFLRNPAADEEIPAKPAAGAA